MTEQTFKLSIEDAYAILSKAVVVRQNMTDGEYHGRLSVDLERVMGRTKLKEILIHLERIGDPRPDIKNSDDWKLSAVA